jgi:hypothetical protein
MNAAVAPPITALYLAALAGAIVLMNAMTRVWSAMRGVRAGGWPALLVAALLYLLATLVRTSSLMGLDFQGTDRLLELLALVMFAVGLVLRARALPPEE